METPQNDLPGQPVPLAPPPRRGRTRRVVTAVAASALLLGGGAAIGIATTGGASASTSSKASPAAAPAQRQCAKLAAGLKSTGHRVAASRLAALCKHPLLRLVATGGTHGEVTFEGKDGARTIAFERGTIASVGGSQLTVTARDGATWTWDLASAAVGSAGHKLAASSLSAGEHVLVVGTVSGSSKDARLIRVTTNAS
jgi:hypothetical protein